MYCRNCGHSLDENNINACTSCGRRPNDGLNYCQECGSTTTENQVYCFNCNNDLKFELSNINYNQNNFTPNPPVIDEPNMVANLASAGSTMCCTFPLPVVGVILYLVWKDTKPKAAQSVCYWTIGGFILPIILYIVFMALSFMLAL